MPRNRNIYQVDMLYVGPSPATGNHWSSPNGGYSGSTFNPLTGGFSGTNLVEEIFRVQSANYSFNKNLVDVNQFGELAAIERIPLNQPVVNLDFSYLLANFVNEANLGFTISSGSMVSAISGILNNTQDSKNYFVRTVGEGNDVVGVNASAVGQSVIGIGNGSISNYSMECSVGSFPRASMTVEGLNMEFWNSVSGNRIPAVNPIDGSNLYWYYALPDGTQNNNGGIINARSDTLGVLRPGDITLSLGTGTLTYQEGGPDTSDIKPQRVNLSFSLSRTNLEKLGSKYAYAKVISFPVTVDLTADVVVGDLTTGSLVEIVNNNISYSPNIRIKRPNSTTETIAYYELRGAKLDSISYTSSIGPSRTASMKFTAQIAGPQSITNGLFLSGQN